MRFSGFSKRRADAQKDMQYKSWEHAKQFPTFLLKPVEALGDVPFALRQAQANGFIHPDLRKRSMDRFSFVVYISRGFYLIVICQKGTRKLCHIML
jgi:hypothetical protein